MSQKLRTKKIAVAFLALANIGFSEDLPVNKIRFVVAWLGIA